MKKIQGKKTLTWLLVFAMLISMVTANGAIYTQAAKKVKLNVTKTKTLKIGKSYKLKVKNLPKKAKKVKYKWTSSKKKVASVSQKGKVKAKKTGTAKITCKVTYRIKKNNKTVVQKKKLTCKIKVVAGVKPIPVPTPSFEPTNLLKEETTSPNGIKTYDNGIVRENVTASQIVKEMGLGWNLGNTMECTYTNNNFTKPEQFETCWNNKKVTTEAAIDGLLAAGINSVRIPVAWSNMISKDGNYTINQAYFNRVETIMNYALNNGMYVVVNIHWDGGWLVDYDATNETTRKQVIDRFAKMWKQIAERYEYYSDHLIFESLNEESDYKDAKVNSLVYTNPTLAYSILTEFNQTFVNTVRATGGNNAKRHLLIAGYCTDIDKTCDSHYKMPTDTIKNHLAISVHYYTPWNFCGMTKDESWGKMSKTWGTASEVKTMKNYLKKMKTTFADKGYPVIIGEYGCLNTKKRASTIKYLKTFTQTAYKYGFCPMLWDNGENGDMQWYDRYKCKFIDVEVGNIYAEVLTKGR